MKVAIAGFGLEGRASYAYWKALGHEVIVVDEADISAFELPYGSSAITGKNAFKSLKDFDLVVRTASLAPSRIKTKGRIWSATNEFFDKCPAPIIGVTGTKGKGTTASLIASILRAAGKTVHLVGNIGVPALEVLPTITPDDLVVFELSSFQLWDLERSPNIAVVLMIEPDHLNVHSDMKDYIYAKTNIRRHQGSDDHCIYHPTNEYAKQIAMSATEQWDDRAKRYAIEDDGQVYVKENTFFVQNNTICSVETLQIVGAHNVENACAAISAALHFSVDNVSIEAGLRAFTGLDHRLKLVKVIGGVSYYDDSIATTPGSAIAAIESFSEPKVLILGGSDKGSDYLTLIKRCSTTQTTVVAIGSLGGKITELCRDAGVSVKELGSVSMSDIVSEASGLAQPGSVVILSPAAASFDMFKNYADRGDQFISAVSELPSQ